MDTVLLIVGILDSGNAAPYMSCECTFALIMALGGIAASAAVAFSSALVIVDRLDGKGA